jgi:hypothetical protein
MADSEKTVPSADEVTTTKDSSAAPAVAPADLDIQVSLFGKPIISARATGSHHRVLVGSVRDFLDSAKD